MAKKRASKALPVVPVLTGIPGGKLSPELSRNIEALRKPFLDYVQGFASMSARRDELAPRFMAALDDWRKETGRTQFIEFCRTVDPSIPTRRDDSPEGPGYRNHRSYQAADYLRRKSSRTDSGVGRATPIRNSSWKLSRLLATLLPLVRKDSVSEFWNAIATEFDLAKGQVNTLKRMTETTQPIMEIHAKPQPLKMIHVEIGPAKPVAEPIAVPA